MPQTKERRAKFKIITFEIPIEAYNSYQVIAQKQNKSFSSFIREALAIHAKNLI